MIIDFDGYQVKHHPFIVRNGSFSWFLENKLPYLSLEQRDRKTVNYVFRHIHGLRFESSLPEKALPQHMIKPLIDSAYHHSRTPHRYMVGHLEKDLLNELQIPSVNLEDFGCPKVEKLIATGFDGGSNLRSSRETHPPLSQTRNLFVLPMAPVSSLKRKRLRINTTVLVGTTNFNKSS